jgi:hypothetical protein
MEHRTPSAPPPHLKDSAHIKLKCNDAKPRSPEGQSLPGMRNSGKNYKHNRCNFWAKGSSNLLLRVHIGMKGYILNETLPATIFRNFASFTFTLDEGGVPLPHLLQIACSFLTMILRMFLSSKVTLSLLSLPHIAHKLCLALQSVQIGLLGVGLSTQPGPPQSFPAHVPP